MHFLALRLLGAPVGMELFLEIPSSSFDFGRTHSIALGSTSMEVVHPKYLEVVYHFVAGLALRLCYLFGAVVAIKLGMVGKPGHASEGERRVGYES